MLCFQRCDHCWPFLHCTLVVSRQIPKMQNCSLSVSILTSKNISGKLFGLCLSLNLYFLPFSGILNWKSINHSYLVVVYTLNIPSAPYFFVYNHWKRHIYFSCCPMVFKILMIPFFFTWKPLNMLGSTLFVLFVPFRYVISAVFCSLTCNCISSTSLVAF